MTLANYIYTQAGNTSEEIWCHQFWEKKVVYSYWQYIVINLLRPDSKIVKHSRVLPNNSNYLSDVIGLAYGR